MAVQRNNGFTLLEIILVLVIASILGVMMVQFVRTSSLFAVKPAIWFKNQTILHEMMEKTTTEYKRQIEADTLTLAALKTYVLTDSEIKNYVSTTQTGYITFSSLVNKTYSSSSVSVSQGSSSVLIITLIAGDQSLRSLFVE